MRVGEPVAAKSSEGGYYFARIVAISDEGYEVVYGNGNTAILNASDMLPISKTGAIDIGTPVLGIWQGAQMYPGVVMEVFDDGKIYKVQWDDGSAAFYLPADKIAKLP